MKWNKITDILPDNTDVIVIPRPWYLVTDGERIDMAIYLSHLHTFMGRSLDHEDITHWMPQPELPKD